MKRSDLNRREILVLGRNLLLTSLAAGLPPGCSIRPSAGDGKWTGNLPPVDGAGVAVVRDLTGPAFASMKPLSLGDSLESGVEVALAAGGKLTLSLPDRSILQLKDESRLKLDLDSRQGGDLTLHYGSLLSVVTLRQRGRRYRIKGAAAQVDVKGTVCFLQTFKPGDNSDSRVPQQATDYFCICNGEIDYLNPAGSEKAMSSRAEHHNPYFLYPEGSRVGFIKTKLMMNHDDREILNLINQMEGEKHPTGWLRDYRSY